MVEKLSKALEGLKSIQFTAAIEDTALRKKEKMLSCALVADLMVSLRFTNAQNVPQLVGLVVESLIHLCDDKDSDVRMVADESLDRIIRALTELNMLKVQVELHKEIKKNGPARCLRAALWRFGQLSSYIRPNKSRSHVQNLIPCIIEISKRDEESVHETLATFIENTFKVIGVFLEDNDIKNLIKAFIHNLSSSNTVIRRTSAACIISIVKYCRKQHVFNSYILNILLDSVVPVSESNSSYLVVGVLGCLRLLLPNLSCDNSDEGISGSFGLRRKKDESLLSIDRLIQIYELCLYYSDSKDCSIVTASLETLNQLLLNPPPQLESLLCSPLGINRSYIHSEKETKVLSRAESEISVAYSISAGDESLLIDDTDITSFGLCSPFTSLHMGDSKQSSSKLSSKFEFGNEEITMIENPFKDKLLGNYMSPGEIFDDQISDVFETDAEQLQTSDISASSLLMRIDTEINKTLFKELSLSESRDDVHFNVKGETLGNSMKIDIGTFTDQDIPLIYCARHLAASFLLEDSASFLKSDGSVRVSIKSLALSCLSSVIRLHPVILTMNLAKNDTKDSQLKMKNILMFFKHSDPQIRGNVCVLVASFIKSLLNESKGFECDWMRQQDEELNFQNLLMQISFEGVKDDSSVCSRQALSSITYFINQVLLSIHPMAPLPLLHYIPLIAKSSYWLLKVKLAEVVSNLPFIYVNGSSGSDNYQNEVIHGVFFYLLGDEDPRVRTAASESLARVIPRLTSGNSALLSLSRAFTAQMKNCLASKTEKVPKNDCYLFPPFSYINGNYDHSDEDNLSMIVTELAYSLTVAVNKYSIFGYLEALKSLSEKYPPTVYLQAWNCFRPKVNNEGEDILLSNLLTLILSLLVTSPVILDLAALSNATTFLGNLFAGHCICNMKNNYQANIMSPVKEPEESTKYWDGLRNKELSILAEQIFTHVMKVLNIYSHILEEVPLSKAAASATAATNLLPISLASPIKKPERKPDKEDKVENKKQKSMSNYRQSPQYMRLYQLLKNAHNNYKVSLDSSVSEKFLDLLESTINVLCILLEIGTVQDTDRCAEEILSYLRPAISLRASKSVVCVIQLMKSLFGTNLGSNWEDVKIEENDNFGCTLFANIYQLPSEYLSSKMNRHSISSSIKECENLMRSRRRLDRKIMMQNTDKNCLTTYIRLLEPMIIKSLQLYTITNDVFLQANVLRLVNQLILLRVNYCLVDSNELFLGFVLKQFELIERGQIPGIENLLPEIFKFLVLLSYEKHHSKTIMSMPKILQLCDGLMASNQSTQTHCIPALVPIVEDVFLSRNLISTLEQKELETQREVVLSMLLRLVEFHEVMNMLTTILNENRTMEEREKWKRWSRQVMDTILPLASQDRLRTETFKGQEAFNKLMSSLSPNVLRPIDPLLKTLFVEPNDYSCTISLKRWLARVTVLIETLLHVKEDVLLCRLDEISPNINLTSFSPPEKISQDDPFNVKSSFPKYESSETFARFLLKVICVMGFKILDSISSSPHFQQQTSLFFLCIFHILKSGTFHRVTNSLQCLLTTEKELASSLCSMYIRMKNFSPVLSCQFTYFLALLNYFDRNYWTAVLSSSNTLPSKLMQSSGVISLCDYLCEILSDTDTLQFLLSGNIKEVILLSNEPPVKELITTIHRRSESTILMEAISVISNDTTDPVFVEKLLRILEIACNSHSGLLLLLLVKRFIKLDYVGLTRLADMLACRRAEYLLTLSREEVHIHLDEPTFREIMNFISSEGILKRRHSSLFRLLNKMNIQFYNLPVIELDSLEVDKEELKTIRLTEDWYAAQVQARCCQDNSSSPETAILLSRLDYKSTIEIMSCSEFNIDVLSSCLSQLEFERKERVLYKPDEGEEALINSPLYKALFSYILNVMSDVVNKLNLIKQDTEADGNQLISSDSLNRLMEDKSLFSLFARLLPSAIKLMDIIDSEKLNMESSNVRYVMLFGFLCIEVIFNFVRLERVQNFPQKLTVEEMSYCVSEKCLSETKNIELELCLSCCISILRNNQVSQLIPSNKTILNRFVNRIYDLVRVLICRSLHLSKTDLSYPEWWDSGGVFRQKILLFVTEKSNEFHLPTYLKKSIRNLIICLCKIPEVNNEVLNINNYDLCQDLENLGDFISRFSILSWTSRHQFERIWMELLLRLPDNSSIGSSIEETTFAVQVNAVAIEGLTTLLKNTMMDAVTKKIIHHGRDSSAMRNNINKLPLLINLHPDDQFGNRSFHFLDNLEISKLTNGYQHGLLSVEYIWTSLKKIYSHIELYKTHSEYISEIGLDLKSCVQLLMQLYSREIFESSPDIRIIMSCLKSSVIISDLFSEVAQFQWLLEFCVHIENLVIAENVVILPLIIIGCCKAASVIVPDLETCEKIKRLMLHSRSITCRTAAIQGLLYLLQSPVVSLATNYEKHKITNIVDTFLPVAIEMVQEYKQQIHPQNEEYERCSLSLIFYLLNHYQPHLREDKEEMLNIILVELSEKMCSDSKMILLVRGIERLLLTNVPEETFSDQVSKIASDMISQNSVVLSRCGLQLLMVLSFLEKRGKDIRLLVTGQEDPEKIMKDMEKVNVLFDKLRKSYPDEAKIVGDVISYVLIDFTASDVLTKVIQEFLSSQQPHLKILSGLLFKVFERAERSLLEDWVVFSLPSFINGLPITMSVWILNCFFVSACNEPWLRSLFPLVQSRVRMVEAEDKKLLCLSGSHFYRQLKDVKQKKLFLETFQNAAKTHNIFSDLLSTL